MYVWDVPIDAASFVCLAMAIGLSVDYVVHLSHAVATEEEEEESSSSDAIAKSLDKGPPRPWCTLDLSDELTLPARYPDHPN